MNKMYLVLGDWSDDGHGKTDKLLIETSHLVGEVQQAYKDSCKLTGMSLNSCEGKEDYTELGRHWKERSKYELCVEYENNIVSEEVLVILEQFDCPYVDNIKDSDSYIGEDLFINLLLWFIGLSLNNFKWEKVKDDIPCINGYWNKDLNVGFGYGLYD